MFNYFELYNVDSPERKVRNVTADVDDANPPVSCDSPNLVETRSAVNQLKSEKASGSAAIAPKFLKRG